jgi:hypothetical protein
MLAQVNALHLSRRFMPGCPYLWAVAVRERGGVVPFVLLRELPLLGAVSRSVLMAASFFTGVLTNIFCLRRS